MARGAASTVARTPTRVQSSITPQERVTALQRRCPLSPPVCSISHETECTTNVAATALQAVSPDVLREAQMSDAIVGPLLRGEEEGIRPSAEMATLGCRSSKSGINAMVSSAGCIPSWMELASPALSKTKSFMILMMDHWVETSAWRTSMLKGEVLLAWISH